MTTSSPLKSKRRHTKSVFLGEIAGRLEQKIIYGFRGNQIWVSTDEKVQYHLANRNAANSFWFGLNIENRENIEKSLKGRLSKLQLELQREEWRNYKIAFN